MKKETLDCALLRNRFARAKYLSQVRQKMKERIENLFLNRLEIIKVNVFVLISKRHFFSGQIFAIYITIFQWVQTKMINFTH